jgi:hypothetical protein
MSNSTSGGSTLSTGAPAPSDRNSLTIGPDGPILLHDVHFLEQMAHFKREKVPERQPHAKGSGAFGVIEATHDVSAYTLGGARSPVLERAFDYWKSIDPEVGSRIERKVRAGSSGKPAEGMGEG